MKIDSEQGLCHGTISSYEPNSKPFDSNNNSLGSSELRSGNGVVKEDENGVLCDLKGREGDAGPLRYVLNDENGWAAVVKEDENGVSCDLKGTQGDAGQLRYVLTDEDGWAAAEFDCSKNVDDLTFDHESNLRNLVAPSLFPSPKMKSHNEYSIFYMDKSVMELELPELIVCYRENTYHVVKDICIDNGVPSQDKFLLDTGVDENNLCRVLLSEKDIHSKMEKRNDLDMPIPDVLKSSAEEEKMDLPIQGVLKSLKERGAKYDFSPECNSKDLTQTGNVMDHVADDTSKEIFSLADLFTMPEQGSKAWHPKSSGNIIDVEQKSGQRPSENPILPMEFASGEPENGSNGATLGCSTLLSAAEKSDHGHEEAIFVPSPQDSAAEKADHGNEEAVLRSPALFSAEEEPNNGAEEANLMSNALDRMSEQSSNKTADELSDNSKMENESITFDFDTFAPTASQREDCPRNGESGHLGTRDSSRLGDPNREVVSNQPHYINGESSFSAAGPLSGLISYSGPIAYSGSVSLRSDSSTTSTRSFAFPVLQSEWNSSPVRMAKADRRHFWKHWGWWQGLLCCRF